MSKPRTRTLGALLYEDFELLDLYGPLEMFREAVAHVQRGGKVLFDVDGAI
jgi:hypothetical protein